MGNTSMRSPLYVKVEAVAGTDTREVIDELVSLARRLRIGVQCDMNGVTVCAHSDSDSGKLFERFEDELHSKHRYKYASV
jgi:hypothetical protein